MNIKINGKIRIINDQFDKLVKSEWKARVKNEMEKLAL